MTEPDIKLNVQIYTAFIQRIIELDIKMDVLIHTEWLDISKDKLLFTQKIIVSDIKINVKMHTQFDWLGIQIHACMYIDSDISRYTDTCIYVHRE